MIERCGSSFLLSLIAVIYMLTSIFVDSSYQTTVVELFFLYFGVLFAVFAVVSAVVDYHRHFEFRRVDFTLVMTIPFFFAAFAAAEFQERGVQNNFAICVALAISFFAMFFFVRNAA